MLTSGGGRPPGCGQYKKIQGKILNSLRKIDILKKVKFCVKVFKMIKSFSVGGIYWKPFNHFDKTDRSINWNKLSRFLIKWILFCTTESIHPLIIYQQLLNIHGALTINAKSNNSG